MAALALVGTPYGQAQDDASAQGSRSVAVVVHPDVPEISLDRSDLLDLYLGDVRFWDDGTRVVLFDQRRTTDVKESFYDYLGRSISRMKSLWLRRRLAGEGDPPEALASDDAVLTQVAETPGAIGFVRADRARGLEGIRVVRLLPIR
ncbi:MAG: hypothetical protein AAF624_09745 [Bacteroidota bacterium]